MATCPRCFGALTENHKCPRSAYRGRVVQGLWTIGVGGLIGAGLTLALTEHPASMLVLAFSALGAVLASAVRQAVGGGER